METILDNIKVYEYKENRNIAKVALFKMNYKNNNNLAILMYDVKYKTVYSVLTVNLVDYIEEFNCAFIDTNNVPNALKFIRENKLGVKTGKSGISGFCIYPEVRFDLSKMNSEEEYIKLIGEKKHKE